MRTQGNHSDRCDSVFFRRSPGSLLLRLTIFLYDLLLLVAPVCLTPACSRTAPPDTDPSGEVSVPADDCRFTVRFRVSDNTADSLRTPRRLDIFVYNADGLREQLLVRKYDHMPDSAVLYCKAYNATVVAIANSPHDFNTGALGRYDSIELLTYSFEEDSPESPVMSGQKDIEAGGSAVLVLSPLLSRVQIGEVSNKLKGYIRLEDPRIYLENMNANAEVLRTAGFHPSETVPSPPVRYLPYDIGRFTQSPGTELFCYPNDSPEAGIGSPPTVFVMECEIQGATRSFRVPLPPISRNSTTRVDISVSGDESFDSKVY